MLRRAADKLLSLRSVASSPWSLRGRTSESLSKSRQDVTPPFPIATDLKRVEPESAVMKSVAKPIPVVATPLYSTPFTPCAVEAKRQSERSGMDEIELEEDDLVDYDFINAPFGTEEKPAVMRSYYDVQITYCCGPEGDRHDNQFFWIQTGEISVCPLCSQHFTLECVGMGGLPPSLYEWSIFR